MITIGPSEKSGWFQGTQQNKKTKRCGMRKTKIERLFGTSGIKRKKRGQTIFKLVRKIKKVNT